jgi:hypothetical protein
LIVVGTLGGIPGIGGGTSEAAAKAALASQRVAVTGYFISNYDTVLTVRNNNLNTIRIDIIQLDGTPCTGIGTPTLRKGESRQLTCSNVYKYGQSTAEFALQINYTDLKTQASYAQQDDTAKLVGNVALKYQATLDNHATYNSTSNGCWNWTSPSVPTPHPICTCNDLEMINTNASTLISNYTMLNSIDLFRCDTNYASGTYWTPIGNGGNDYKGIFNGAGFAVLNVQINSPNTDDIGFFGSLDDGRSVQNLSILNANVIGQDNVGILAGVANVNLLFYDIDTTGSVAGRNFVGGIVGQPGYSTFNYSTSSATVTAMGYGGGLIGGGPNTIENSHATGRVIGGDAMIGGLIGYGNGIRIKNSYATGEVNGTQYVGGLAGHWYGDILNSYATGDVTGTIQTGGLAGIIQTYGDPLTVDNSYATGTVRGTNFVGGIAGMSIATITNSHFTGNVNATGYQIGGLAGYTPYGAENSYVTGYVAGDDKVGGLIGYTAGTIDNSYTTGRVYGNTDVGGILGSDGGATFNAPVTWKNYTDDNANDCTGDNGNPAGCSAVDP